MTDTPRQPSAVLTRRQRQIVQLMREGWEIRTQPSPIKGGTAQLERTGDQPRRLSWETAQRLVIGGIIAPTCYVRESREKLYLLYEQVHEPHMIL